MDWPKIYKQFSQIISLPGETYYHGTKFFDKAREIDLDRSNYEQYLSENQHKRGSPRFEDYFYEILSGFDEKDRLKFVRSVLNDVEDYEPTLVAQLRREMGDVSTIPSPKIGEGIQNAEELSKDIERIDSCINRGDYNAAVTLSYKCLEGFLRAFVTHKVPDYKGKNNIIDLTKEVRDHLEKNVTKYPAEVAQTLGNTAHAVNGLRNQFSDAHSGERAEEWLAILMRDLVNAEIRHLLHFV